MHSHKSSRVLAQSGSSSSHGDKRNSRVHKNAKSYWRANISLLTKLLAIWFVVSYLAGIILVDLLNNIIFLGVPLGFWFAQQGAVYVFVILIFYYGYRMQKIERDMGLDDDNE